VGGRVGHYCEDLRVHQPHDFARSVGTVVGVVDGQHIAETHANHIPNQFFALASKRTETVFVYVYTPRAKKSV